MAPWQAPAPSADTKKLHMANTLSFNWKTSVRFGRVLSSLRENPIAPNSASPPSLQTTSQVFLTGLEGPCRAERETHAERGPQAGRGWEQGWRGPPSGPSRTDCRGTAPSAPSRPRPRRARKHDLGRDFRQRSRAFRLFRLPAFLPGRDFLAIIDRCRTAELVGGAHRRSVWGARPYAPRKGTREDALPRSLSHFFLPASPRLRGRPGLLVPPPHLRLFRFLFSQAPPPASRGHDDRPAGLPGVEARGAAAGVG